MVANTQGRRAVRLRMTVEVWDVADDVLRVVCVDSVGKPARGLPNTEQRYALFDRIRGRLTSMVDEAKQKLIDEHFEADWGAP